MAETAERNRISDPPRPSIGEGYLTPSAAVEVLPAGASRDAWLAERRKGIGGSDVMATLGLHPFVKPYDLWADKTGRAAEVPPTDAMLSGIKLEPVVADWYTERTGNPNQRTGMWRSLAHPWAYVNPDRFLLGGGLECKTTNGRDRSWKAGAPAEYAEGQCQWAMFVLGPEFVWWDLACLTGGQELTIWRIDRDDATAEILAESGHAFWTHNVKGDTAPPVTGDKRTKELLKRTFGQAKIKKKVEVRGLAEMLGRRRTLKATVKNATAELDQVENELRAALGDAEVGTEHGTDLVRLGNYSLTRTNEGLLRDEYPDAYAATRQKIPYRKFEEVA